MSENTVVCLLCKKVFKLYESNLVRSVECGHAICLGCACNRYPTLTVIANKLTWSANTQAVKCAICSIDIPVSKLVVWQNELSYYSRLNAARTRVYSIMNCDRATMKDTPTYNSFLEDREELILTLVESTDLAELNLVEQKLSLFESKNQSMVFETQQRKQADREEQIKNIVENEGTFYETLKQPYRLGFHVSEDHLMHPLVVKFSHLFTTNQSYQENSIFKNVQHCSNKIEALHASQPQKLETKRQEGTSEQRALAGGYEPKYVLYVAQQETFAYFI